MPDDAGAANLLTRSRNEPDISLSQLSFILLFSLHRQPT
ncbi:hypothetical protein BN1221_03861c [Brenneria goodwinii]|uniref:Uncharacterized protein n=1 Tax=Brenneria goodwinii TaxID=1109412 RepID=A0A0G4JZK5_9GAMM|nr:hypothetical protein BN1221_03861c [Brenneria goodwinii]